jgi:hypothetical protein
MRRWIVVFLLFIFLVTANAVQAQGSPVISHLQIEIWPEYDRPDVLIIYRMKLSEDTPLPAKLTLRIPSTAGNPFNVAMQDVDGMLYTLEYTIITDGDWIKITFVTPSSDVQIEYYDPNLVINQNKRSFEYIWPGDYPITNLGIRVQQPINALNMSITPDMGGGAPGQDGLVYYNALLGEKNANEPLSINLSYDKPDHILSSSLEPVLAVQENGPLIIESRPFANFLPWALAGMGVLLIAGGAIWYWRTGRASKKQSPSLKRHNKSQMGENGPEEIDLTSSQQAVYCPQCGKRAVSGDLFCRSCGGKLRK